LTQRGSRGTLDEVDTISLDGYESALMHAKITGTRSGWRRRLALAAAVILMVAQSLGAAHYHPFGVSVRYACINSTRPALRRLICRSPVRSP
jgi:hypothetical protein